MHSDQRKRLREIRTFPSLVKYLHEELDWPIKTDDFEELTFEYTPEELGIDSKSAAKIQVIRRLRPLSAKPGSQPWGIFFVKFEPKRLPVVALRRILSRVAVKKRASSNSAERAAWQADDLLFISSYGEGEERRISFAHFSQNEATGSLPVLKVLGWDNLDTALHIDDAAETLKDKLSWPEDEEDADAWRETWRSAFTLRHREVITTSKALAVRLAELARAIRDRINTILAIETEDGPVSKLMAAFKEALVHDLDEDGFADMYAQTIAYGLLSASIADPSDGAAGGLAAAMPVTNPFLKELMETFLDAGGQKGAMDSGLGLNFDELGVSEVAELLDAADMEAVVRDFGDRNPQEDPVIHFYELFLKEYDAKKRTQRGVFYTPRPVVSFIVRSVDELLRTELGLEDGLADTTTRGEMAERFDDLEIPEGATPDQAFVQILDPATGTGTFLVEVIDLIHKTMMERWQAEGHGGKKIEQLWNDYVPKHLLPRLHGYELMMAPYTVAHMKIGLKLHETGYRFESDERARVYLTNALEPAQDFSGTLAFAIPALAHEAEAANAIKRDQRFTVVIGNPPYAQYSMNLGDDAKAHIEKFRYANGTRIRARNALQLERNLNDDYVKFLGFAVDRFAGGGGVLGMITNRMFLDSESLVGLREWFARNFECGIVFDLHGSSEEARRVEHLAGDENVFDILQGVAVTLLVRRHPAVSEASEWYSRGIVGDRERKYASLLEGIDFNHGDWKLIKPQSPDWWLDREPAERDDRVSVFTLDEIFPAFSTLVASNRDHLVVGFDREKVRANATAVQVFEGSNEDLCEHFEITPKRGWNITGARNKLRALGDLAKYVRPVEYRPFDQRWIFFHATLVWQTAPICSRNVLDKENRVLISLGKNRAETTNGQWITSVLADKSVVTTRDNASGFPLYLYDGPNELALSGSKGIGRCPNLERGFLAQLTAAIGLDSVGEFGLPEGVSAEDIQGYIYAVLYSPSYRSRYAQSLVSGFPPIPLPPSLVLFRALANLGDEVSSLHMMESPVLDDHITTHIGAGDFQVEKVSYSNETVWIDRAKTCGFQGVPEEVWSFQIGGYQVCEKWLKDRQGKGGKNQRPGRVLTGVDIDHYQRIVVALSETIRIMAKIDEIIEAHGGWPAAFQAATEPSAIGIPTPGPEVSYDITEPRPTKASFPSMVAESRSPECSERQPTSVRNGRNQQPKDIDRGELVCLVRRHFADGDDRQRGTALIELARELGYQRTGRRIREELDDALRTAVRRGILENDKGLLRLTTRSIHDYERGFLKKQFLASLRGRTWVDREEAIRAFARWLGFRRTGSAIEKVARSLVNGLIRDGRIEREDAAIRRV